MYTAVYLLIWYDRCALADSVYTRKTRTRIVLLRVTVNTVCDILKVHFFFLLLFDELLYVSRNKVSMSVRHNII